MCSSDLVATSSFLINVAANDYIQLVWATSNTNISILSTGAQSSPTVPVTPGVILSVCSLPQIGIGYAGLTSVTSATINTGSQTFTTNLNANTTAFQVGTRVRLAYSTNPSNYMEGAVTAFSGTSMTVNVDAVGGSGTYASWNISVAGIAGSNTSVPGTSGQVLVSNGSSGFGTPFSLGTNVQTFLTTPSSANLASALTDKTGTGVNVFATSPSLTTPAIGSGGFTLAGSTSGTTTVAASATASGTITIPAATDTLVGKATTDTLTNKTFDTAGTGNVFKINGTQITANTGTGSNVLATSPTITTQIGRAHV